MDGRLMNKVTSTDVARRAGVSQSAVSRVFTPGASASPATKAKVLQAAAELGYRPDPLARAMITGKSRIVGLVVAYLDNQFYPRRPRTPFPRLAGEGLPHPRLHGRELDRRRGHRHAGTPRLPRGRHRHRLGRHDERPHEPLRGRGDPVVMFNRGQDDPRLSEVTSDNVAGAVR